MASDLPPELDRQVGAARADRDTRDANRHTGNADRDTGNADADAGGLPAALARFTAAQRATARPPRPRSRLDERRDAIRAEIERNRRGEYKVPTWLLGALLVLIAAGIAAFVVFG
ncbi:MAG TPA: hypothetical protein VKB59_10850 [Micromonosporaceae bacterium]|nr:hypothetical protein [Micromonosporaceae bacterium]